MAMDIRYKLFIGFLLVAATQDLREQQVKIWVYVLFGMAALFLDSYFWISPIHPFSWKDPMESCFLGAVLLGSSKLSRGEIGAGDGLFFLVSGFMLKFNENFLLLSGSIMLCGIWCLVYFVICRIQGSDVRKTTVPFLPFALLPGILLAMESHK